MSNNMHPVPMPGPQGLTNPFAPLPVHPTAWSFMPATQGGAKAIMLMLANPHAMATHWFTMEDFERFLEDARAAASGIIVAKN